MSIEDKYQEYYEEKEVNFPTSIHTRVNKQYRISSIYRRASTVEQVFFWETIIWDGDHIYDSTSHYSIDKVMEYHYEKYLELGGL